MKDAQIWKDCVNEAKKKLGLQGYQMLNGPVFKEAQKANCAIMSSY